MFDEKILVVVICLLVAFMVLDYGLPEWGLDFAVFFIGCLGLMVLMHLLGFDEGKIKGYEQAMKEAEGCFFFLPHGGIE